MVSEEIQPLGMSRSMPIRRDLSHGINTTVSSIAVIATIAGSTWAILHGHRTALILNVIAILLVPSEIWRARHYFQRAWLEGTVLVVKDLMGTRRCNLSAAREIRLVGSPAMRGEKPVPVLAACDVHTGAKVRFTLKGIGRHKLPSEELGMLADAIEAAPDFEHAADGIKFVAARLRQMAEYDL